MKVVSVEASQEDASDRTSATDHGAMPMQSHKGGHEMRMEHGSMNHGMCGCGMCMMMMMMGMGNMEMTGMEGMSHGSNSATVKPAAQRSYSSGRGGGRGCGC